KKLEEVNQDVKKLLKTLGGENYKEIKDPQNPKRTIYLELKGEELIQTIVNNSVNPPQGKRITYTLDKNKNPMSKHYEHFKGDKIVNQTLDTTITKEKDGYFSNRTMKKVGEPTNWDNIISKKIESPKTPQTPSQAEQTTPAQGQKPPNQAAQTAPQAPPPNQTPSQKKEVGLTTFEFIIQGFGKPNDVEIGVPGGWQGEQLKNNIFRSQHYPNGVKVYDPSDPSGLTQFSRQNFASIGSRKDPEKLIKENLPEGIKEFNIIKEEKEGPKGTELGEERRIFREFTFKLNEKIYHGKVLSEVHNSMAGPITPMPLGQGTLILLTSPEEDWKEKSLILEQIGKSFKVKKSIDIGEEFTKLIQKIPRSSGGGGDE
ncbi:MAG: hypothetical protein HYU63_07075, partial [Armatimonadetes bacterium]|nr:hypothetical protein [Armatimonadota bacterium]